MLRQSVSILGQAAAVQQQQRGFATLKDISIRLKSVKNIQKITKSMKMVAAAKYAKAERELKGARSYGEGAQAFFDNLGTTSDSAEVANQSKQAQKRLLVLITSDRGLCGAVHTSIIKEARNVLKNKPADVEYKLVCIGDKSRGVLQRQYAQHIMFSGNEIGRAPPTFEDASIAANAILNSGYEFDEGSIIFNRFKTVVSYETKHLPILPIETIRTNDKLNSYDSVDDEVLKSYTEYSLAQLIYYAMKESATSEQSSRMTAMDGASKNAGEMIDKLTLAFNRTRQAVITRELIEIISGAACGLKTMTALPTIAFRGELEKMESAAKLLLFQETTYSQRREAESYFMSLRDANLSPELCRQIIENTGEPYVIFQLAQCLTVQLLRNWNSCTSDELKAICKYLLEFPLSHPNLPSFAIAELFKSAAVIYKRGANWNAEMILEPVSRLLQSTDDAMQTMGLRMIEAFCFELSTVGRTAVPITFQVHKIAKKNFEEKVLKKLMELSLGFLFRFVGTLDINDHVNICDRFLKVAVLVLQWDFPTSVVSSFLRKNSNSPNKSAALRPPPSWSDLFQDEKLLPFFFELHKRVRGNQQLAQNSLQCIMQLAAVMGTVLDRREKSGADIRASTTPQPHDLYVQRFISALIDCFADCHPHELLPFTTAMHRIFSHHPMPIFKRFPRELITNFIKFVVHWARTLAAPAMHQDKENDEYGLVDALTNVLTCWSILLRSTTFAPDVQSLIAEQNNLVIESFLKAVLAPPYGERPANQMETHEQNEDDELDDYRHYAIILTDIGVFCRSSIEAFTQFVIKSFNERINQRSIIAQSGAVSEAERYLWFEDMHWMLLMISSFLQDSDRDIALRLDRGYKAKEWTLIDTPAFFSQCITQLDSFQAPNNADPLTIICGMVAHWTGILLNAIETQGPASSFVSPEICRSTVRTFASTIQFLTSMTDDSSSAFFDDQTPTDLGPLPTLPTTGEFSAGLVDLIIRLCFAVFRAYPGEKQLCKTAVCFLLQESEKRAQYIAKSPILYEQLASISLEKLPSRADFMTCLVNVGSNLSSSQERSQMNDLILQPLANRFLAQAAAFQQNNSEMIMNVIHLLECFAGVARGATKQSARLLYGYLYPHMQVSVRLMLVAAGHQTLVLAILKLFKDVTNVLFVCYDVKSGTSNGDNDFYDLLLQLFENYKISQVRRFESVGSLSESEEEEQIVDLILILQIIRSAISKPSANSGPTTSQEPASSALCQKTLEIILPLLSPTSLQFPNLSSAFYRLLQHISETSPIVFLKMDQVLTERLIVCFNWAIEVSFGMEALKCSLSTINHVARAASTLPNAQKHLFVNLIYRILMNKIFEMAYHATATIDKEVYGPTRHVVYSLILADKTLFLEFAQTVAKFCKTDVDSERVMVAFRRLIPDRDRKSKSIYHEFQSKFDKFVVTVQKILHF